jgi:2Fe-2S ferredoxin
MMDVLKIKDRDGVVHELQAPTDMAMNIMELCKAYEPGGRNVRRNGYVLLANVMCLMMFHCQKWGR